jgi:DNA-binding HxlR family transcriptional regulator
MSEQVNDTSVVPFPKKETKKPSSIDTIWGKDVVSHGYVAVPAILIRSQHRLGISPTQINIIVQLLEYWIDPARKPFPTKRDLANRIGLNEKTIQHNIRELEKAGMVRREQRKTKSGDWNSNIYHLDGLIMKVRKLEPEFAASREARAKAKREVETPKHRRATVA